MDMQTIQAKGRPRKPQIHITEQDYDVIAGLALGMERRDPKLSQMILEEIERARVHSTDSIPNDVATLGSEIVFFDDASGSSRRLRLVLPGDADIEASRISVMTPVGAGLIGMSVGREISWPFPDGRPRILKIPEVNQKP